MVVLDSWAVMGWLQGHARARPRVDAVLGEQPATMSWVNLVEVRYRLLRTMRAGEAESLVARLEEVLTPRLPDRARMLAVSDLKARHPIALGDCFAIAEAAALDAPLLTGDPEILDRVEDLPCSVEDLRS